MVALYGVDPDEWLTSSRRAGVLFKLVERLKFEHRSMWRAEKSGSLEAFDFGIVSHQLAALIDAVHANTSVTAAHGSGKAPRKVKPSYRPRSRAVAEFKPKRVRDMTNVLAGLGV